MRSCLWYCVHVWGHWSRPSKTHPRFWSTAGDYYPLPEVLFFGDLLAFSFWFLFGFVWLSAFLGDFTLALSSFFPDLGEKLGERLQNLRKANGKLHGGDASEAKEAEADDEENRNDSHPEQSLWAWSGTPSSRTTAKRKTKIEDFDNIEMDRKPKATRPLRLLC